MQLKDVTAIIQEIIKERGKHPPTCKYNAHVRAGLKKALRIIEKAPVAEYKKVCHAAWVRIWTLRNGEEFMCTHCAQLSPSRSRFCPSCGYDMSKE